MEESNPTIKALSDERTHWDLDKRLTVQEVISKNIDGKVELIMTNHLPHIQAKVDKVHDKVTFWGGAIAVGTILVPFVINYIFK